MRKNIFAICFIVTIAFLCRAEASEQWGLDQLPPEQLAKILALPRLETPPDYAEQWSIDRMPPEEQAKILSLERIVPPEPEDLNANERARRSRENDLAREEYERIRSADQARASQSQQKKFDAFQANLNKTSYSGPMHEIDQATLDRIADKNHTFTRLDTYDYVGNLCYLIPSSYVIKVPRRYQPIGVARVVDIYREIQIINQGVIPPVLWMLDCEVQIMDTTRNVRKWYRFRAYSMMKMSVGQTFLATSAMGDGATELSVQPVKPHTYIEFTDGTYKQAFAYNL